jgi:NAD+ synthase (glutamine-hydrolysing)
MTELTSFNRQMVRLATCNLNQWALDFDGNLQRVIESIRIAKQQGAKFRLGPELELSGYSCEDHFLELDTFLHCEQSLANILLSDVTDNILCEIGCPILHNNVRYNCRVFCLNRQILLIRPKAYLADDGNYRERRYFASWNIDNTKLADHILSDILRLATGQYIVPLGIAIIRTQETKLACEVCEELWAPRSPHVNFYLSGVEIITNGSGSHHELRKLNSRIDLMRNGTRKCGGVYLYSNLRGCDGNRLYFDGCSLAIVNGEVLAQASQFSLNDVEVITTNIDLETVRTYRGNAASLQEQSSRVSCDYPLIDISDKFSLRVEDSITSIETPKVKEIRIHTPQEECCKGPACWLWDYLRRSGASGFLLPLSGGADSSSVASIVRVMCEMVGQAVLVDDNKQVLEDLKRLINLDQDELTSVNELANALCNKILHTIYMGTENSSKETRERASGLANAIHSFHTPVVIDKVVDAVLSIVKLVNPAHTLPKYKIHGGTKTEDIALQNVQARLRMVIAYMFAQLFPWIRGNSGFLLVLGSANVDEALRGYMTKYDCSSADINPIGGICKKDLKQMLCYVSEEYKIPVLKEIVEATPVVSIY